MKNEKRIEWIDLLRVIAIFCATMCHVVEGIYQMNISYMPSIHLQSKVFAFGAFTVGRWGVPFFLMISGYLLLDREYDGEKIKRFWKKNWLHLLICTEIWFCIYEAFLAFYQHREISAWQVVQDLLFIHKVNMNHVWYMPTILGIYILIPFVANALRTVPIKWLKFPVLFYVIYAFGNPLVSIINNVAVGESTSLQLSLGFSGGIYGLYLIIGYLIKKGVLKKLKSVFLWIISIISVVMGTGLQLWAYNNNYEYNIWYDCVFILIAAVSLFELFSRISKVRAYVVIKWLAKYSFAVYLMHSITLNVIRQKILALQFIQPVKVVLLWLLVMIFSYFGVWLISKIPKIGKYILYIK